MRAEERQDPRLQKGIAFFNARDFFSAHEVWEELWLTTFDESRDFLQALIQWALVLYHFSRGNMRGARRLFESGDLILKSYGAVYHGIDIVCLRNQMKRCLAEILSCPPERLAGKEGGDEFLRFSLDPEIIPTIRTRLQ